MDVDVAWTVCALEGIIPGCKCPCLNPLCGVEALAAITWVHQLLTAQTQKQQFPNIPVELLEAPGIEIDAK